MTPSYPLTNLTTGKTMAEITLPKLLKSPFLVWGFSFRPFRKKLNAPRSGCTYRAEGFSGESGRACWNAHGLTVPSHRCVSTGPPWRSEEEPDTASHCRMGSVRCAFAWASYMNFIPACPGPLPHTWTNQGSHIPSKVRKSAFCWFVLRFMERTVIPSWSHHVSQGWRLIEVKSRGRSLVSDPNIQCWALS